VRRLAHTPPRRKCPRVAFLQITSRRKRGSAESGDMCHIPVKNVPRYGGVRSGLLIREAAIKREWLLTGAALSFSHADRRGNSNELGSGGGAEFVRCVRFKSK